MVKQALQGPSYPVEYASTIKGGMKLILDEHHYKYLYKRNKFSIWQCSLHDAMGCEAKAIIYANRVYKFKEKHNHTMAAVDLTTTAQKILMDANADLSQDNDSLNASEVEDNAKIDPIPVDEDGNHLANCGAQLFILSRKGGMLLVVNDFIYRSNLKRHGKETNKIYWECLHNRSKKCRSRLKTVGDDLYITNEIHNHKSDAERIRRAKQAGMLVFNKFSCIGTPPQPYGELDD